MLICETKDLNFHWRRKNWSVKSMAWIMKITKFCNAAGWQQWEIKSQDLQINSPYCIQYVSHTFSSENLLVKYNLVDIPHSSHFTSAWNCIDIVRRNSYLVTLEYAVEAFCIQISITCSVFTRAWLRGPGAPTTQLHPCKPTNVTLSKIRPWGWHDNLAKTRCLTQSDPSLEKSWLHPCFTNIHF